MTTAVQRRRGTNTEHATFTGLDGEITVNTTTYTLHVHDGATVGGVALAKADGSNIVTSSIDINGGTIDGTIIGGSSAAAGTFTSITGTSANINGTVTADGLTVDGGADVNGEATIGSSGTQVRIDSSTSASLIEMNGETYDYIRSTGAASSIYLQTNGSTTRQRVHSNGDISFYEDTGTTAKFFWDASAESLGIGTSSPESPIDINRTSTDGNIATFRKDGTTVGSIGKASGGASQGLYISGDDVGLSFEGNTNNAITPYSVDTGDRDAAVDLGSSSARFKDLYLSGGVYLGGTGAANKLDDYETGTFTPTLVGAGTPTYGSRDDQRKD